MASTISAAATAARPRHGAVKQQLSARVKPHQKHAAGCWESSGSGSSRAVVARAGPGPLTEIEPDLQEDPIDKWRTNGVLPEDFVYGVYDGHHTYDEGQGLLSCVLSCIQNKLYACVSLAKSCADSNVMW
uniref:Uncharacterized protein n=1 Tax=Aegilops tauschii subsp. strangulata TaxID=200361 RepID=A0A453GEU5_AEGTS